MSTLGSRYPEALIAQLSVNPRNEGTGAIMPDNAFIELLYGKFRVECLNVR